MIRYQVKFKSTLDKSEEVVELTYVRSQDDDQVVDHAKMLLPHKNFKFKEIMSNNTVKQSDDQCPSCGTTYVNGLDKCVFCNTCNGCCDCCPDCHRQEDDCRCEDVSVNTEFLEDRYIDASGTVFSDADSGL